MNDAAGVRILSAHGLPFATGHVQARRSPMPRRQTNYWKEMLIPLHHRDMPVTPLRQIRAVHNATTIRVYQAYSDAIADAALESGTFASPPFKMDRMTWIKPSFLWMMYRAGWGYIDDGQKRILAIDITREGFEWALANGSSSHADPAMSNAEWDAKKKAFPVRIQWDPERDIQIQPLPYRSIQIGLSKEAVQRYTSQWICRINDVTPLAHEIHALVLENRLGEATAKLPAEQPYTPQA